MNENFSGFQILSSLFNSEFLTRPFVRQSVPIPWFYIEAEIRYGKEFVVEMVMVPSVDSLKDLLALPRKLLRILSIQYVTPGFVNGTGKWMMEPLLEATEAVSPQGDPEILFRVPSGTYSGLGLSTEENLKTVNVLFLAPSRPIN